MNSARMRTVLMLVAFLLLHAILSARPASVAGAARPDIRAAKGFVVARTAASLTLLAGDRRVLVAITPDTRVLGQRQRFSEIVLNDVVRAEGRWVEGERLMADRLEVVIAIGSLSLKRAMVTPTFELIGTGH